MNERIQKVQQSYGQWQAARAAEHDAQKQAGALAKKFKQDHEAAIEAYNASLAPTRVNSRDELMAYQTGLTGNEIVRPCFVAHQGAPTSYPCLVVSVRMRAQYGEDVEYQHRFVYPADLALLVADPEPLPEMVHYGTDDGNRAACRARGLAKVAYGPLAQHLERGQFWCPLCQVAMRDARQQPDAFPNPGEFPAPRVVGFINPKGAGGESGAEPVFESVDSPKP